MPFRRLVAIAALLVISLPANAGHGAEATYVGGTATGVDGKSGRIVTTDDAFLEFRCKGKELYIPYEKVNLLEYGQNVGRRITMAVVVSPLFLLSKKRQHFLTVGYSDKQGKQQALVFKVDKKSIRAVLVSLEARTGLKVQFQDEEARKAGKG
jgi:hypothetical protein